MKGKRILSVFLSLVMLISVVAGLDITTTFASTSKDGNWTYTVSDDGTAVITAYNGSDTEITIPATIDGYTVTEVGLSSSSGSNATITSIVISEGITMLSTYAFSGYSALESVSLPSTLTAISGYAFYKCTILVEIAIPDAVVSIDRYAFLSCKALTSILIPDGVTSIGNYAFEYCTSLESVTIGDSVTSIGKYSFCDCEALTSIIIPDSVTSIGDYAFEYCTSLESVTIGNSVTSIGKYSFYGCTMLTSIAIPGSVISVGDCAFSCCTSLFEINVDDENEYYISVDDVLFTKDLTTLIVYPAKKAVTEYFIPDTVTKIASNAFYYCTSLTSITMSDSVTSIGTYAFYNCEALTSIRISDSLTAISNFAFYCCTSLTSIIIPDSVTSIGNNAFQKCTSLESVTVGNSVVKIDSSTFYSCSSLETVTFEGDAPKIYNDSSNLFDNAVNILYHSTLDGWDDAQENWTLVDGTKWYDLDKMVSAEDFEILSNVSVKVGESKSISTNADSYVTSILEWSSSDESIAIVTNYGEVYGLKKGTAVITATTANGKYLDSCIVTVTANGSLTLINPEITLTDAFVYDYTSDADTNTVIILYASGKGVYTYPVEDYLMENSDGTLTRVEYISEVGIVVETFSNSGEVTDLNILDMELPLFGGFYSGDDYNYIVFAQYNDECSDDVEVFRIIKYSKSWERVGECNYYSDNTMEPFTGGSLRMDEIDGLLYIHTCHTRYDGHQSNLDIIVDEEEMTVKYSSSISVYDTYASHSFAQFVKADDSMVYFVDLCDAFPYRGILISKLSPSSTTLNHLSGSGYQVRLYKALGTSGNNYTGISIGGFELSEDNCIIAFNSVDMTDSSSYSTSSLRNIAVTVTDKDFEETETTFFTDYTEDDEITVGVPRLVKISDDSFLLMWEEEDANGAVTTQLVTIDEEGNATSEITRLCIRLSSDYQTIAKTDGTIVSYVSDCQPILTSDGIITWYVSDNEEVTLYQLDADNLFATADLCHNFEATVTAEATCTESGTVTYTCSVCGYTYTQSISPTSIHVYSKTITEATCVTDGLITYTCSTCGDTCTEVVSATGEHSYEWEIANNSYPTKACSVCGDVKLTLAFTDISTETEYFDYIAYTSCFNSLITGVKANSTDTTTTTFSPRTSLTRAMLVTILYRMAGSPYDDANPYSKTPFSDVKAGTWYYNAVCWALDNGITTETKFKPNTNVTREQTATFLYRYAGEYLGEDVSASNSISSFPDSSSVSSYAKTAMKWAYANGMITGTQQGYLNPQGTTLRVHATKILYNFGFAYNIGNFS